MTRSYNLQPNLIYRQYACFFCFDPWNYACGVVCEKEVNLLSYSSSYSLFCRQKKAINFIFYFKLGTLFPTSTLMNMVVNLPQYETNVLQICVNTSTILFTRAAQKVKPSILWCWPTASKANVDDMVRSEFQHWRQWQWITSAGAEFYKYNMKALVPHWPKPVANGRNCVEK